jgi:MFS family permease
MTAEGSSAAPRAQALPGAGHALALLLLINLFNYIDRQVLAAVEPEIARTFFPKVLDPATGEEREPPGSNFLMGLLSTAFMATYMLTSPIFGALSTRMSRWLLIGAGVTLWSVASGASGLAAAYWLMFLTRCFVGVGEAVYGPVAPDVISDLYPVEKRGQTLAWFYAAIPFGGALGYALGDRMVQMTGDWRWAFYVVVPPGLALGAWCFFMPEPPRGGQKRAQRWSDYLFLLRIPSYLYVTLGMTAMTFAMGGIAFWVPRYLEEREVPTLFGLGAKTDFGLLTALGGLAATLAGGWAGDGLRGRYPGSYFLVSGLAMLGAVPLLLLLIVLPFPLAWLPLVGCVFCLFFNTGPTNTILANVAHPMLRAPGFALNILIIHLLGDAISPAIMGGIKDVSSLNAAFVFVSVTVLLGGVLWLWGTRHLQRDTELAPTRLPPEPAPASKP